LLSAQPISTRPIPSDLTIVDNTTIVSIIVWCPSEKNLRIDWHC
jgi:hypothetical protein